MERDNEKFDEEQRNESEAEVYNADSKKYRELYLKYGQQIALIQKAGDEFSIKVIKNVVELLKKDDAIKLDAENSTRDYKKPTILTIFHPNNKATKLWINVQFSDANRISSSPVIIVFTGGRVNRDASNNFFKSFQKRFEELKKDNAFLKKLTKDIKSERKYYIGCKFNQEKDTVETLAKNMVETLKIVWKIKDELAQVLDE